MPGEFDPTNYMLPQQPLHKCLFPKVKYNRYFQIWNSLIVYKFTTQSKFNEVKIRLNFYMYD